MALWKTETIQGLAQRHGKPGAQAVGTLEKDFVHRSTVIRAKPFRDSDRKSPVGRRVLAHLVVVEAIEPHWNKLVAIYVEWRRDALNVQVLDDVLAVRPTIEDDTAGGVPFLVLQNMLKIRHIKEPPSHSIRRMMLFLSRWIKVAST
jgi:hypothetical protein